MKHSVSLRQKLHQLLAEGDLRFAGNCGSIMPLITNARDFRELFHFLFHDDRVVVMHTADCIEKITRRSPEYLHPFKNEIIDLARVAIQKEFMWHLAELIPRTQPEGEGLHSAWQLLMTWLKDPRGSRIVRVNALQALHDLSSGNARLREKFREAAMDVQTENIPSLNARIRKLLKSHQS